jgi:hypothetical protein
MPTDTLANMVRNLRSEAGHSLSVAQGVNTLETLKYLLKRTQEELWTAFTFPDLKHRADIALVAGTDAYVFPTGMTYDQIRQVLVVLAAGDHWASLTFGIPEDCFETNLNLPTPDRGTPAFWDTDSRNKMIVYPAPATTGGVLRLIGNKPLAPFISDSDLSTLDATLIVLFASVELLARAKAEDAASKEKKAQRHLQKLMGAKISSKMKVSTLGGGYPNRAVLRPGLDYVV